MTSDNHQATLPLHFFTTVNDWGSLPHALSEVAFVGRSNAGKSSAINTLANHTRLAYVSKTPGRTQHLNYFQVELERFVVDLPGYGYAAVPGEVRDHWRGLLGRYLGERATLRGLFIIMDTRHPMKPLDQEMISWFLPRKLPIHILLTKSDKLSKQKAKAQLALVRSTLPVDHAITVQLFSSLKKQGAAEAIQIIHNWLGTSSADAHSQ